VNPTADTIYADVSEWQVPVDDDYPHRVLCIRSNDGTHRDANWTTNYRWCTRRCDQSALDFFIVYVVWRRNWRQTVDTLEDMVGRPHPRMAVMLDVETWGGRITGDQSDGINRSHSAIGDWLGDRRRVIGYGTVGDLNALWPRKPVGLRVVVAAYGSNPDYPGKVAHQYTDDGGYGNGDGPGVTLPNGAPPFGRCDMNSADGLSPPQFAAACGIQVGSPTTILADGSTSGGDEQPA